MQRFLGELRRRHVPQTIAVYAVAAWAAIEFADVIVPNLGWPQGVVTAVIIAAAVGLPAVTVLAWVFDWGPEGIRRTPPEDGGELAPGDTPTGAGREAAIGRMGSGGERARSYGPWLAAVVVLAVAIGSGVAVMMLVSRESTEPVEADAPRTRSERRAERGSDVPAPPGIVGPAFADSVVRSVRESLAGTPAGEAGLDLDSVMAMAMRFARTTEPAGPGAAIEILEPEPWRVGVAQPVTPGDTIRIRGLARDERGIAAVVVAGETVARAPRSERPTELPFQATVLADDARERVIAIVVRTGGGEEIRREFPLLRIPARP